MMTPLLFCVNRGYMEIVRQLIDMGADRTCSDKNVSFCFTPTEFISRATATNILILWYFSFMTIGSHGALLRGAKR